MTHFAFSSFIIGNKELGEESPTRMEQSGGRSSQLVLLLLLFLFMFYMFDYCTF